MKACMVGLLIALLAGCENETPVSFYVCDALHENCFLEAKFKTMDACKSYEQWSGMLCDSMSQPGVMTCREVLPGDTSVTAYCAK